MLKQMFVCAGLLCAIGGIADAQTVKPSDADPTLAPGGSNFYRGMSAYQRPRFRSYVERERRPSYAYDQDLRAGAILPESGYGLYDLPEDYGMRDYRYTVVNGVPVVIEPRSRRVMEIFE